MVPCTGPFRWESVPCPKGCFLVTSVAVSILVYLRIVTVALWEDLESSHLTSHLFYLRLLSFSFLVQRWTGICIFAFPEFSMILLAEPDPLPQLQEVPRISKSPRRVDWDTNFTYITSMSTVTLWLKCYYFSHFPGENLSHRVFNNLVPNHTASKY